MGRTQKMSVIESSGCRNEYTVRRAQEHGRASGLTFAVAPEASCQCDGMRRKGKKGPNNTKCPRRHTHGRADRGEGSDFSCRRSDLDARVACDRGHLRHGWYRRHEGVRGLECRGGRSFGNEQLHRLVACAEATLRLHAPLAALTDDLNLDLPLLPGHIPA
jgi:hypothetical protein